MFDAWLNISNLFEFIICAVLMVIVNGKIVGTCDISCSVIAVDGFALRRDSKSHNCRSTLFVSLFLVSL